ncbi:MAG: hypothetical protein ACI9WU_000687 [Myxococcota bacterium]|jgi:hypothetical protein
MSDLSRIAAFKRINFFRGFMTTEEDWNAAERYHIEKRKLHNRLMHAPGLVPHAMGGFKVGARGKGELAVEVSAGYAVDGEGNDIVLPETDIKPVNPGDFKLPNTIYIVARYIEEFTDFIAYKENLEFKGHRRVAERCRIDVEVIEPDITREIELCRIYLEPGVRRITEPRDPENPKANEIDRRFRPVAGFVGSNLAPATLRDVGDLLELGKNTYSYLFHDLRILTASDVLHALLSLEMLLKSNLVDLDTLLNLFDMIAALQWQMIQDIDSNYPQFGSRKEFGAFKKNLEIARGMGKEEKNLDFLINTVGYQRKSCESLQDLFAHKLQAATPASDVGAPTDKVFEAIKVRSADFTKKLEIEGAKFKMLDIIDLIDEKSESSHKFKIDQARDRYRTRQKLKYPDGVTVEDVGVAYEGGFAEFEITGCTPKKDVIMITRMDYVHGDYETEMYVNGKKVGNSVCPGNDRRFRWRNWPFVIPGEYVNEPTLKIKQVPITAGRDVNMFKIWFYHPA